jgi:hypothetical protein
MSKKKVEKVEEAAPEVVADAVVESEVEQKFVSVKMVADVRINGKLLKAGEQYSVPADLYEQFVPQMSLVAGE